MSLLAKSSFDIGLFLTVTEVQIFGDVYRIASLLRNWATQYAQVAQFLEDSQRTLQQMQQDFPNLCDMYAISIHPSIAQLAQALGFQATFEDPSLRISWLDRALDSFLELDVQAAVTNLNFHQNILKSGRNFYISPLNQFDCS